MLAVDESDLLDEMLFLRKGAGMVASRLPKTPIVELLLRQHESDQFGRMRSRLESAILSLGEQDAPLLLDVFGLTPQTAGLSRLADRRQVYAGTISRGVATVSDLEEPAIRRLMTVLIRGTYRQSPLLLDVPEMHDGIIYESASTLIIVEDGMWRETREHYRFAATFDEADFLTITRSYAAIAETPDASAFRVQSEPTSHGFNDDFWHRDHAGANAPMTRGNEYDLVFSLRPDPADPPTMMMTNAYRMLHARALLATLKVQFIGKRPTTIWKYERVSHFAQPGAPEALNKLDLSGGGAAVLFQRDVHGGLANGIAWGW